MSALEFAEISSMTGQGTARSRSGNFPLEVEIRTVNSRYRDVHIRNPFEDFGLEGEIRDIVQRVFTRGRIDVVLRKGFRTGTSESSYLRTGEVLAFLEEAAQLEAFCEEKGQMKTLLHFLPALLQRKEFLETRAEEVINEQEKEIVRACVTEAAQNCFASRIREGEKLRKILEEHLQTFSSIVHNMKNYREQQRQELERVWKKRQEEFSQEGKISPERLHQELFFLIERSDITEELHRFLSHADACESALRQERPLGRKLDFLCQELGRELNTIGSKAQYSPLQHLVVEAKLLLEQFREQVQNIE